VNQQVTQGIVLSRTEYGEADRIITFLTPDQGKLTLMAKGVRRQKSKLAGGVELFSVTDITYIRGRGSIGTLISARLQTHYGNIVKQLERVQVGYELTRLLHKITEDQTDADYFVLLQQAYEALNTDAVEVDILTTWFQMQLLVLAGYTPNLQTDAAGDRLSADKQYNLDLESMTFELHPSGQYGVDTIKTLRLLMSGHPPSTLGQVEGVHTVCTALKPLLRIMMQTHLNV
jgi:DNA repair protein RecO (recombination protein O)